MVNRASLTWSPNLVENLRTSFEKSPRIAVWGQADFGCAFVIWYQALRTMISCNFEERFPPKFQCVSSMTFPMADPIFSQIGWLGFEQSFFKNSNNERFWTNPLQPGYRMHRVHINFCKLHKICKTKSNKIWIYCRTHTVCRVYKMLSKFCSSVLRTTWLNSYAVVAEYESNFWIRGLWKTQNC